VRGLRSGLPITETLSVVSQELPGPVGEEFKLVTDRIKVGRTMEEALQETADRLDMAEFSFFCITLAIQRETGGNLAETLANLADVLRKRAQMKLKISAMSSESKASAYIVGSLPFIVFALIYSDQPALHGQVLRGRAPYHRRSRRLYLAWHRRLDHGADGQLRDLRTTMPVNPPPHGPTLLGVDVIFVGSILMGIAAAAMLLAIYAAITVRDPMAKRVKALNDRRDELKAGIVTVNAKKRQSIVRRNETTDNIKTFLESLKVLQDSQLKDIQQKLAQAGIRKKEWAVAVVLQPHDRPDRARPVLRGADLRGELLPDVVGVQEVRPVRAAW
jgi:Flp pilus assembly protein TadB